MPYGLLIEIFRGTTHTKSLVGQMTRKGIRGFIGLTNIDLSREGEAIGSPCCSIMNFVLFVNQIREFSTTFGRLPGGVFI